MTITIHRGQDQIGGSIIEIASDTTKIILDAGSELDEEIPTPPPIDGLFSGTPAYDAVFVSHYHGDHLGLCEYVLPQIPLYIGKGAAEVTNAARRYLRKTEYTFTGFYESSKTVTVGDIHITPYLCDHSAYDAYMFHITCGDKTLVYSGDFRSNGRKSFPALLRRLPCADALIIEGTTLTRTAEKPIQEEDLEAIAAAEMTATNAPAFIFQAATNIDRIVTAFKAACRSGRVFLQDLYTAEVSAAAGGNIPNPLTFSGIRTFMTGGRYELLNEKYGKTKIGKDGIAREKFLMCVRPTMQRYLEALSEKVSFEGGVLFYSMWSGYKKKPDIAAFLQFMQDKGVRVVDLHTSGHADEATIRALVQDVSPKYILPVHTENAAWFEALDGVTVVRSHQFTL